MTAQWWALFRPGRPDPEAVDYDKSDLVGIALRRSFGSPDRGGPEAAVFRSDELYVDGTLTRESCWKRLRRRGWRIEPLPERFWEAREKLSSQLWAALQKVRREGPTETETLSLLRELAEDRHKQLWSVNSHSHVVPSGHHGTLRTCRDRLCDAAATLLGRG